jgi:hypothetical protein
MPTFMRSWSPLALALMTACSSRQADSAPAPDPTPSFVYSSEFTNFDPLHPDRKTTYTTSQISANATATTTRLQVHVGVAGEDLYLDLPLAALTTQWVGTYALRCPQRPADPVAVTYCYYPTSRSAVTYEFATIYMRQPLAGSLTITAYDARQHLLSGYFAVNAWQQLDPQQVAVYVSDFTLTGAFSQVKLKL